MLYNNNMFSHTWEFKLPSYRFYFCRVSEIRHPTTSYRAFFPTNSYYWNILKLNQSPSVKVHITPIWRPWMNQLWDHRISPGSRRLWTCWHSMLQRLRYKYRNKEQGRKFSGSLAPHCWSMRLVPSPTSRFLDGKDYLITFGGSSEHCEPLAGHGGSENGGKPQVSWLCDHVSSESHQLIMFFLKIS